MGTIVSLLLALVYPLVPGDYDGPNRTPVVRFRLCGEYTQVATAARRLMALRE